MTISIVKYDGAPSDKENKSNESKVPPKYLHYV